MHSLVKYSELFFTDHHLLNNTLLFYNVNHNGNSIHVERTDGLMGDGIRTGPLSDAANVR